MSEPTPSAQIDHILGLHPDWRGETMARLRTIINAASPDLVEEVKWKKPSRPEGVPVWTHNGNLCILEALKTAVRLTFPYGATLSDPHHLFNTRLGSKTVRAIDFTANVPLPEAAITQLVQQAVAQF